MDQCKVLSVLCVWGYLSASGLAADWLQFRGGPALSVASATRLPNLENGKAQVAWRRELPGSGWSQPVVVGSKLFVTTAVSDKASRPKGMASGAMDLSTMGFASAPKSEIEWKLICLDASSGTVLWEKSVAKGKPNFGKHASNTYATETPAASEQALYVWIAPLGLLVATDHGGNELWRKDLGMQKIQNQFGTGSSPLLVDDALIIQQYNEEFAKIVCLDSKDGSLRWQAERPKGTSWATPIAWQNGDHVEIIGAGVGSVIAYDLTSGSERWRCGGLDTSFSCSVVADRDGLYFGTSSPGSRAPIMAIRPGQSGDLTLAKGKSASDSIFWSKFKSGAGMPSPVVVGDLLYFVGDSIVCYNKLTGAELYRKRLPGGTLVAGCPLVIGDRLVVVNEKGKMLTIPIGEEFRIDTETQIGSDEEVFWATPAVQADRLFIRSSDAIYCVQ